MPGTAPPAGELRPARAALTIAISAPATYPSTNVISAPAAISAPGQLPVRRRHRRPLRHSAISAPAATSSAPNSFSGVAWFVTDRAGT